MLRAFPLALAQLGDPPIVRVFLKSIALTLVIFAVVGVGVWYAAHGVAWRYLGAGWGALAEVAVVLLMIAGAWLLFRAVAVAVVGVFADEVVQAVEAKHYPDRLAVARNVPLAQSVWMGLGSAGRAIGVNLLFVPLYLVLAITGVGTAVAFFVVNAWLLGRDLGDMVAVRHLPKAELARWRRGTRVVRWTLGAAGTGLLLVPFVNLVAPVLAAAMATHVYHRRGR